MKTDRPFLYPSVTSVPKTSTGESPSEIRKPGGGASEFDEVFGKVSNDSPKGPAKTEGLKGDLAPGPNGPTPLGEKAPANLSQLRAPLKLSSHASQRLNERSIRISPETWNKVNDAVDRAEAKGIEDTLVLTSEAALIVNVKNRTVITAMDKGSLTGNVFTNIDGAVIV